MIGEIRRSQLISTFGVGAIVNTRDHSVMVAGIDDWPPNELETINEPRLQKKLGVFKFSQPKAVQRKASAKVESIPCVRFPRYVYCPKCHRLGDFKDLTGDSSATICRSCEPKHGEEATVIPSRFVTVCRNGHIDDFPWQYWINCQCKNPKLSLEMSSEFSSLAGIRVKCLNKGCNNVGRTMQDAFLSREWRGYKCTKNRPWLSDIDDFDCAQPVSVMQRGATSVHFPVTESAISIPPYSDKAYKVVQDYVYVSVRGWPPSIEKNEEAFKGYAEEYKVPASALVAAYNHIDAVQNGLEGSTETDEDLKIKEYEVLTGAVEDEEYDEGDNYIARPTGVPKVLRSHVERIVLVDKLRVVTALRGFNRISPSAEKFTKLAKTNQKWLPATEIYGEGIFIELSSRKITEWRAGEGLDVVKRLQKLEERREKEAIKDDFVPKDEVSLEFVLLHTLSHVLIRTLALECGYSSSSLQERLYCGPDKNGKPMLGVLIYTASSDSEGSLGGLVRQGIKERFEEVFYEALNQSTWCSSDPLCLESTGQGSYSLNLAACHSCALIPEPACEFRNCYLDRATLIGTKDNNSAGYFSDLL